MYSPLTTQQSGAVFYILLFARYETEHCCDAVCEFLFQRGCSFSRSVLSVLNGMIECCICQPLNSPIVLAHSLRKSSHKDAQLALNINRDCPWVVCWLLLYGAHTAIAAVCCAPENGLCTPPVQREARARARVAHAFMYTHSYRYIRYMYYLAHIQRHTFTSIYILTLSETYKIYSHSQTQTQTMTMRRLRRYYEREIYLRAIAKTSRPRRPHSA